MGLQNNLSDVSSESLPVLLLSIVVNGICYLRSLVFTVLRSSGVSPHQSDEIGDAMLFDAVGSGLAGLILLVDQLNLNRLFSYDCRLGSGSIGSECVVCLNRVSDGEQVRKLACGHVFHKECIEGWLHQFNFNCPLCRSPLITDERVEMTRRRVASGVRDCFSLRR